ncbi:MAG: signal recognition particle protein [Candidatus Hepatoplasma vulgare]|nr:MAG: signal recognition particle protein [Candidatus Hepatoplasma sp.]
MSFNFLQNKLEKTIKKVSSKGMLSEENINNVLSELKINLLESDVNLKVVNNFLDQVKEKATGLVVSSDRTSSQEVLKVINKELINVFGKETKKWNYRPHSVVMFVGLQGSGKTTSTVKLANYLSNKEKKYKKPLLVALDVYRPAAYNQLETLSKRQSFDFFGIKDEKNVNKILNEAIKFSSDNGNDLIILDTAGRLQTDEVLMNELKEIKKIASPTEIIFTADGMAGQEILNVAETFNENLKLTSAIITKMDSSAKGGASLSIASSTNIPIQFIGTGEKISNIELFHPDRMVSRILGLGDIETLTEKAMEVTDEKKTEKMMRKMMDGKFDLDDLLTTISQVSKMGSFSSITRLIPGMKLNEKQGNFAESRMKVYKYLIDSMTEKEKKTPALLNHPKRKNRILKGSGRSAQELNSLVHEFDKMKKQMKEMGKYIKMGKLPNLNNLRF